MRNFQIEKNYHHPPMDRKSFIPIIWINKRKAIYFVILTICSHTQSMLKMKKINKEIQLNQNGNGKCIFCLCFFPHYFFFNHFGLFFFYCYYDSNVAKKTFQDENINTAAINVGNTNINRNLWESFKQSGRQTIPVIKNRLLNISTNTINWIVC